MFSATRGTVRKVAGAAPRAAYVLTIHEHLPEGAELKLDARMPAR